ncbi:MAG: hypothetical protein WCI41_03875 [bacterium]
MNKLWFKRKSYGWGWTPCSWEGWIVILVWIIALMFIIANIPYETTTHFLIVSLMVLLLIFVCYKKGEKPKWQWGNKKDK